MEGLGHELVVRQAHHTSGTNTERVVLEKEGVEVFKRIFHSKKQEIKSKKEEERGKKKEAPAFSSYFLLPASHFKFLLASHSKFRLFTPIFLALFTGILLIKTGVLQTAGGGALGLEVFYEVQAFFGGENSEWQIVVAGQEMAVFAD